VNAFVDDVREEARSRRMSAPCRRGAADPGAELLYRLPASEAYRRRRLERRRRPSADGRAVTKVRAPRPGDRRPPACPRCSTAPTCSAASLAAASLAIEIARLQSSARPARGGRGVAIARRPGRVRGAPAARA
jgi:hypothetical protein